MSITDELRRVAAKTECANGRCEKLYRGDLDHIADRIDAEHESACAEAYGNGVMSVPIALDESAWVELPKDADGEYIHIGDELDVGFVARIVITDDEWPPYLYAYKETPHILTQYFCNEVSHYHAPSVEDVLREMLDAWGELPSNATNEAIVAEYAQRLQLREVDE